MRKHIGRLFSSQAIRFLFTGGWNTIFSYIVFSALYYFFGDQWHYMVILTISTVAGVTNAYICHKFFVFKTKGNYLREYFRFYVVYSVQIAVNYVSLPLLLKAGMSPYLAMAVILGLTTLGTYFGHKHISFRTLERSDGLTK
jgi:putative flippase GtrA